MKKKTGKKKSLPRKNKDSNEQNKGSKTNQHNENSGVQKTDEKNLLNQIHNKNSINHINVNVQKNSEITDSKVNVSLEKNNIDKNQQNHQNNEIKIPQIKNLMNFIIVRTGTLLFFSKFKNSYKYKMGNICIKNSAYDSRKKYLFKKIINDDIVIIDNKKEPVNKNCVEEIEKEENSNSGLIDQNITLGDVYIKDEYYNKKEGLYNSGCTCYLNSFIQILVHVPGLIERLMDYKMNIPKNSLLYILLNVVDNPSWDNLYNLRKEFIKMNSNYKYYAQEDSQEFGAEFLKMLNNELSNLDFYICKWKLEDGFNLKNSQDIDIKKKLDKLNNIINNEDSDFLFQTLINHFFYFYETELIVCNGKVMNTNYYGDVDNQLPLDSIDSNNNYLELKNLLNKKYLNGNNKLIKLPIIFNITLLRAIIGKPLIKTKVKIEQEIDLKEFLDKDFGDYFLPTIYRLYALNVCIGSFKRTGHYYSYILINNEWFKFDDTNVRKVQVRTIEEDLPYIYGIYYINKEYLKSL